MGYNFAIHVITLVLVTCWGLQTATACHNSSDSEPSHSTHQHSPTPCSRCTCPPKSIELLAEQFNNISNSKCVSLSRIDVPIDGFTWTPVYFITTNTSCIRSHYDSQSTLQCSWSQEWVDLGADCFPRFVANVQCRGSDSRERFIHRNLLKVLRRQDHCDDNGEVWIAESIDQTINVACDCILPSI